MTTSRRAAIAKAVDRWLVRIQEDPENGCWLWPGSLNDQGEGLVCFNLGGKQRNLPAHRAFYLALVGPVPSGKVLRSTCRRSDCVNPAHREALTRGECALKGRSPFAVNARKTECVNGHPLTGTDALVHLDPNGRRRCVLCNREVTRRARAKRDTVRKPTTQTIPNNQPRSTKTKGTRP
jgi:hypothetical protein